MNLLRMLWTRNFVQCIIAKRCQNLNKRVRREHGLYIDKYKKEKQKLEAVGEKLFQKKTSNEVTVIRKKKSEWRNFWLRVE